MSHEYAMSRVADALSSCGGNAAQAQRLVMSWLEKDQTLLLGLVAPHIKSLVTHAVTHAAARARMPKKQLDVTPGEMGDFGQELLASVLGRDARAGGRDEPYGAPPSPAASSGGGRPGKASKAHVSAMQTLASRSGKSGDTSGKKKK